VSRREWNLLGAVTQGLLGAIAWLTFDGVQLVLVLGLLLALRLTAYCEGQESVQR